MKQSTVDMVNAFLDWAQQQQNGWISTLLFYFSESLASQYGLFPTNNY